MTSYPAVSTLRIGRRLGGRLFVVLAVLALVTPTGLRAAVPDGAGWFPGHGHLVLTAEASTHAHGHPWDHAATSEAPAEGSRTPGVVFTLGDLDAVSPLAMVALPAAGLLLAVVWRSLALTMTAPALVGLRARPLVPPPQR